MGLVVGSNNPDNLNGTTTDDEIRGLDGNDTIQGLAGNDLIYGNLGNDVIDTVNGIGNDTIYGGQGTDFIGFGNNPGADLIYGNFGNDSLEGGQGSDTIFGGQDNDTLNGASGNDLIYGNLGNDSIEGGFNNDTLYGGQGNDVMGVNDAGNDIVYGNFGNDVVTGGDGNNTVYGGQGNDLVGEIGGPTNSDLLFGNLGADTFDFSAPPLPQSGQTTATADRIGDFSTAQGDKIKIDVTGTMEFIALGNASVNSVETAITAAVSANAFAAHDVVFVTGPGTSGFLLVDQNDAGGFGSSTDFAIVLQNFTTLTASDIIAI
jgi:Ca2+-binding RTX toxin-like protein